MTREKARKHLIDWINYVNDPSLVAFINEPCSSEEILEAMIIDAEALSQYSLPKDLDEAANSYASKTECAVVACRGFKAGAEWMAGQGWLSVNERLPEMDEEVIVLTDELGTAPVYKIAFGHIVDVERCIDYNSWNIPGVKYWMSCPEIPNND